MSKYQYIEIPEVDYSIDRKVTTDLSSNPSTDLSTEPTTSPIVNSIDQITIYLSILFFMLMVLMEILTESLFREYDINNAVVVSTAVTFAQFLGCFIVPLVRNKLVINLPDNLYEFLGYLFLTVLVYCSTGLATLSIEYVSYPTKVIFKSIKLVPTMIISTVLFKKRYLVKDYIAALLLCFSAMCYAYTPTHESAHEFHLALLGVGLLVIAVMCDAVVPNLQHSMMTGANSPAISAEDMMINTNLIGLVVVGLYIVIRGDAFVLVKQSPDRPIVFILHLLSTGLCLGLAVNCYTHIIKRSGSVVAVAVSTLRKIASILLSYLIFPKPITTLHIVGAIAVAVGLIVESIR